MVGRYSFIQMKKRYETNFTEYDTLTKGPLYEVFRVQNKIDKSIYAIKKVSNPLLIRSI